MSAFSTTNEAAKMDMALRVCYVCKLPKPDSEFYRSYDGRPRNLCRACNRARAKRWAKRNPEMAKRNGLNYRNSDKGRAKHIVTRREWRKKNTAGERERFAHYVARCADGYMRQLLRGMGNMNPTDAEIEKHRQRVFLTRARRAIVTMAYGARIEN